MNKKEYNNIYNRIDSIENNVIRMMCVLAAGLIILIVIAIACFVQLGYISDGVLPTTIPTIHPSIIEAGCLQRIGVNSIMVSSRLYDGICDDDLSLLAVGDYVSIEKSVFFGCDNYRVKIQIPNVQSTQCK